MQVEGGRDGDNGGDDGDSDSIVFYQLRVEGGGVCGFLLRRLCPGNATVGLTKPP